MITMTRLLPFLLLLLLLHPSESMYEKLEPTNPIRKMNVRRLGVNTQDYDYGGPNPRHDPHKGRPGIGGAKP
ncbi:hypothetical protein QJS10_CPB20g01853 [Acorus calamus]|uniref:Uncharacterized protein n=1 Tax=Acorus calamus TaxID=4465 RepID=A0AAV9C9M3_ACOCL|nr:hypothetical protein QJS10_CPB20g01853 [Acorus calamus]